MAADSRGSGAFPNTSGVQFAKQGVVLVAMNYRVGRFGFFAFPALSSERPDETKGNYAYMDQIAALQWVKRNIAAFGGNPNNVTIFGFSAGGVSVHSMLASPQARGLFQKAIVESGGSRDSVLTARPLRADGVDPNYPVSAETIGINFAKSMGIEGTDQAALANLRGLSADQVLRGAAAPAGRHGPLPLETTPILDGKLMTETAETAYKARRQPRFRCCSAATAPIPRATGSRRAPRMSCSLGSASGAPRRRRPTIRMGRPSSPRLLSRAERRLRPGRAGPLHRERVRCQWFARVSLPLLVRPECDAGTDAGRRPAWQRNPFVFGTLTAGQGSTPTPEDQAVSRMAHSYWVNFAKTGDPNGAGLPIWPRHDPGKDLIFDFRPDGSAGAGPDPRKARLDVTQLATESGKRSDF